MFLDIHGVFLYTDYIMITKIITYNKTKINCTNTDCKNKNKQTNRWQIICAKRKTIFNGQVFIINIWSSDIKCKLCSRK